MGGYLSHMEGNDRCLLLASIAAALVCAGGNALNDFLDIDSDKISHPSRPLVDGSIPSYIAIVFSAVSSLAAIVISIFLRPIQAVIVVAAIIILIWYNFQLKKTPFWGNMTVAFLGSAIFIFGGLTSSGLELKMPGILIPTIFAFLFHLGRELIKDIADYEGDKTRHFRTLPNLISPLGSLALASFIATALLVLTIFPILQGWYRPAYAIIAIVFVDLPLAGFLVFSWFSQHDDRYKLTSMAMKAMMVFGMAAFLFGRR